MDNRTLLGSGNLAQRRNQVTAQAPAMRATMNGFLHKMATNAILFLSFVMLWESHSI